MPRPYLINGVITIGGELSVEELEKMRTASKSEIRAMGIKRHKQMLRRRARHLFNKVDTGYGLWLSNQVGGVINDVE